MTISGPLRRSCHSPSQSSRVIPYFFARFSAVTEQHTNQFRGILPSYVFPLLTAHRRLLAMARIVVHQRTCQRVLQHQILAILGAPPAQPFASSAPTCAPVARWRATHLVSPLSMNGL